MILLVFLLWFLNYHLRVPLRQHAIWAYLAVLVMTFLSSCTIIFPVPGTAVVMTAAAIWNPVIVAIVASIGASLGEITGYWAGRVGENIINLDNQAAYQRAVKWMNRYGTWAIFFIALIPVILFDIIGLAAGALKHPLWKFLLACWGGRLPRSFLEAYVGAGIIPFIFPSWFS